MKARLLLGFSAFVVTGVMATGIQVPQATAAAAQLAAVSARTAPLSPAPSPNVSARASSSWQTNDIVWALAYAKGVVYAGGQFTSVRPPGDALGTGEVTRTYLAAFNATTGQLITSFNPDITGASDPEVTALAISPDHKTLYVGGVFDHVNGSYRDDLAAFNIATGALTSWAPTAPGKVDALAVSPSGKRIYLGGNFSHVDGVARTYAGAVDASGNVLPWAPVLNSTVYTLAVTPNDSQVLLGGFFQTINGVAQNAAGAVDPATGAVNRPWKANIVPWKPGTCTSAVKNIVISGTRAYLAAEGNGGGCFDGDFAVNLGSTDSLAWQNDCLGATQALAVINGWLFKGSHAHDCAFAPGGFPQVENTAKNGWITHHLLDQSLTDGSIGHWNPNTNVGTTNLGTGNLGPHALATDGKRLFAGGDFSTVNGHGQQGFAIFGPGPDTAAVTAPAAPKAASTSKGVDSVRFTAVSTSDIGRLAYAIYRDGGSKPIATLTATSWPWALPVLHYRDAGLKPGSKHTYQVTASDGARTSAKSAKSAAVTVDAKNPAFSYVTTVKRDHPSFLWRLNQSSGTTALDSTTHHFNGIYKSGTTKLAAGPIKGAGTATSFNGLSAGLVTAAKKVTSPAKFSVEAWFHTSTNRGGEIVGFGTRQTGLSATYDRNIYMMNDGQLVFGIWNGAPQTIVTPNVYNDGHWHYVIGTFAGGSAGTMSLYIDGHKIGTTTATAHSYAGYWRVGGDNLTGWNLDFWGSNSQHTTEPLSYHIKGVIGDVAVYPSALSAARVAAHYAANSQGH
jgi:Concanavalin A-like lectin/glucanases superfamily